MSEYRGINTHRAIPSSAFAGLDGVINVCVKPHCVFDSIMRPEKWYSGINDWHTNLTEPRLIFPMSFLLHLTWILNLCISYPRQQELFNGDDDASSAFCWVKYHPNLVALHSFLIDGTLMMATGQTFGDKGCPANWEAIAKARQALAKHPWSGNSIVERAKRQITPYHRLPLLHHQQQLNLRPS
jgi:hypothetical protein